MSASTVLTVSNLCAGYKNISVINDVSFELNKSAVTGLAGLNGQGKTTLIKTILGLKKPQSGSVEQNIENYAIAYLPERFTPAPLLTGEEFIHFSLGLLGQTVDHDVLIKNAAHLSFKEADLKRFIKTYSKGMKQKIGILSTFLADVPLIILDEPMSGLDPMGRKQVKHFILNARKKGQSVFLTSHVLTDFVELCDHMLVFHDKEIRFSGTPQKLLENSPSNDIEGAFLSVLEASAA